MRRVSLRNKPTLLLMIAAPYFYLPLELIADTACSSTIGSNGSIDGRSYPTTTGNTVINGRSDGNPLPCTIAGIGGSTVNYPNGLTINSAGESIIFRLIPAQIDQGLAIDDANIGTGTGMVTFQADKTTNISGPVTLTNNAKLKFIVYNNQSSTTRLRLNDAYFNLASGTELHSEFKLGDTTGSYISVGAIQGAGDIYLTNVGKSTGQGSLIIHNGDGQDYQYSGTIHYDNQSFPELSKQGSGTFTFTGDVKKTSGDTLGFTNGFGLIEISDGALETTSNAFVFGTKVLLQGGDLILNQNFDAELIGATFDGTSDIYKRGTGKVTFGNISHIYRGDIFIEQGTLGLSRGATLYNASSINIASGATLDVSQVYSSTRLSRLAGNGTLALGSKNVSEIIRISPGNSIGILNVTGSGTLGLSGTLITTDIDPTQATGNVAGVTHDQLAIQGPVSFNVEPVIKLVDTQQAQTPTAFLNGRTFTVLTASSGLSKLDPNNIIEDTNSFHAFIGADPEQTTVTDDAVTVVFGIKTAQQVATTVATTSTTSPGGQTSGSTKNKTNATQQYLKKTLDLNPDQKPTQAQLTNQPELQNLNTQTLAEAVSNNNPEAYSSHLTLALEYADLIANMAMDHASGSGLGLPTPGNISAKEGRFWMDASYVNGQVDGKKTETGDFEYDLAAIVIGSDIIHNEHNTLGLFVGSGTTDMDEHDHIDQDFEGTIFQAGLYHQYRTDQQSQFNTTASVFYGDHDSERNNLTTDGSAGPRSKSDFSTYGVTIGAKAAKTYTANQSTYVTPSAGLTLTHIKQDSIKESGGGEAYDYHIDQTDADAIVFGLGVDITRQLVLEKTTLIGDFRLRYEYDAYANKNKSHDIKAHLEGQPTSEFVGQNRGPHGLLIGLGIEGQIGKQLTLGGGYLYSVRSEGHENSLGANLTYFW